LISTSFLYLDLIRKAKNNTPCKLIFYGLPRTTITATKTTTTNTAMMLLRRLQAVRLFISNQLTWMNAHHSRSSTSSRRFGVDEGKFSGTSPEQLV
jgi:hypothetical protein